MTNNNQIKYIDGVDIKNKRILLRADFDVSLNADFTIANDIRIQKNLPTIHCLLNNNNKLICVAKLNRPKTRDSQHSLQIVVDRLKKYLPNNHIKLINDFLTESSQTFANQASNDIYVLENIRFYPQEKENDGEFTKKLAALADVYVNDAFSMCHRKEASVTGVPQFLPSYGGLLLKKEIAMISKAIDNPQKPVVAIIGGAKISTKINLLGKLMEMADYLLIGGGLANIFLLAQGNEIGQSFCENDQIEQAKNLLDLAKQKNTELIIPVDVVTEKGEVKQVKDVSPDDKILDIGPETQAIFGSAISKAKTIVWNGPVGLIENPLFRRGSDFIYYSITQNTQAISIVGGGDTLAAISKKEYLDKITHISTGGGAMLEFIEKGTLPGIEALK